MENNYPKDRIEEGMPPLDLKDDLYEDDPYEDYDFLDRDSFLEEEIEDPYEGLDDICGKEDADELYAEQMRFYDPMDDDDDTSDDYFDPEDDFYDNIGFGYGYEG